VDCFRPARRLACPVDYYVVTHATWPPSVGAFATAATTAAATAIGANTATTPSARATIAPSTDTTRTGLAPGTPPTYFTIRVGTTEVIARGHVPQRVSYALEAYLAAPAASPPVFSVMTTPLVRDDLPLFPLLFPALFSCL
jgi:hypothetical protein